MLDRLTVSLLVLIGIVIASQLYVLISLLNTL